MKSGGRDPKGPIQGLKPEVENLQEKIQELQKLERFGSQQKVGAEGKGAEVKTGSQFVDRVLQLRHYIHNVVPKLENSQVYQTFRLPGREYLVRDLREGSEKKETEETSDKATAEARIKDGKLIDKKESPYKNYLSDPLARMQHVEEQAATDRLLQLLTAFEKALVERFEKGTALERALDRQEASFLKKTLKEWQQFFAAFTKRTVKRTADSKELQQVIFRDWVQGKKQTLVSDLLFQSGHLEKFARLVLEGNAVALAKWASFSPGARVDPKSLAEMFGEKEIRYLAIREGEGVRYTTSSQPTKGMFLESAHAEEKAAVALGLPLSDQLRAKTRVLREGNKKRRGAGAGADLLEEEVGNETPQVFVPGLFGERAQKAGAKRWFVPVVVGVLMTVLAIAVWGLFRVL